jgi:hypothetical protein
MWLEQIIIKFICISLTYLFIYFLFFNFLFCTITCVVMWIICLSTPFSCVCVCQRLLWSYAWYYCAVEKVVVVVILFLKVIWSKTKLMDIVKKIPHPSPSLRCSGVSKELWDQDSWLSLFFKKKSKINNNFGKV